MTTVTIFCIGTDHYKREEYNILCVLHRLTVEADWDKKFIYDGAPLDPKRAAEYLNTITDQAIRDIESVDHPDSSSKITVNLVGHSRGAANCLLIASRLSKVHPAYECNLFLIDTVKYAPKIPEDEVRLIRSNVKNLVHVIMEDNTLFLFDLYEIKKDKMNPSQGTICNIRIPGRHGTATQCNTIVPMNENLKPLDPDNYLATNLDREQLWPIGGLTLSLALQQLKTWGTRLHQNGEMLATDDWQLFFYHRIEFVNPIISRLTKKRRVNDTKTSSAGEPQKSTNAPGMIMRRSELLKLRRFGENPFRFNPIFINEHHVHLCRQKHGNDLIEAVLRALKTGKKKKQYELQAAVIQGTEQTVINRIKDSFYNDALFLKRLHAEGFVWSQDRILYDLLDQ